MQESQQFKHNFLLLFMKLRWFLKRWRQGKVLPNEEDDFLEVWLSLVSSSPVREREPWDMSSDSRPEQCQVGEWVTVNVSQ